jgi:hypothetical protein
LENAEPPLWTPPWSKGSVAKNPPYRFNFKKDTLNLITCPFLII